MTAGGVCPFAICGPRQRRQKVASERQRTPCCTRERKGRVGPTIANRRRLRAIHEAAPSGMTQAQTSLATQVALAGVSNAMAATVTNPIDVVKVRLQLDGLGTQATRQYSGIVDAAAQLIRREGLSGLYRGIAASVLRELSYSGLRMGLYEPTKQLLGATDPSNTSLGLKVLSGALTGCFGSALANPLDLIKVRMQSATGAAPYASVGAALSAIRREGYPHGARAGSSCACARSTYACAPG